MTICTAARQTSAGVRTNVPLRVLNFNLESPETGGFSEDTETLTIFRTGAFIPLRSQVSVGDFLRIVNMVNYSEADFHVVGLVGTTPDGAPIWGIERDENGLNFWGAVGPAPGGRHQPDALELQCRACGVTKEHLITPVESEVFDFTGTIALDCHSCGKPTFWTNVDPNQPSGELAAAETSAPPQHAHRKEAEAEKRVTKRSQIKLPILLQTAAGEKEITRTIDISKHGMSVPLFVTLKTGDTVGIVCPYEKDAVGIEQKAEVCWRAQYYTPDFPRMYGLRFVR
jgi:hypothetical protein